jgi:hypothetical protein
MAGSVCGTFLTLTRTRNRHSYSDTLNPPTALCAACPQCYSVAGGHCGQVDSLATSYCLDIHVRRSIEILQMRNVIQIFVSP